MGIFRIAVDGPSGAGKSTIAKALAAELGIDYIDTGAMYRAVGFKLIKEGISLDDIDAICDMLSKTSIDFDKGKTLLDGDDISSKIRTPQISKMASDCSALPVVREKLVDLQRKIGQNKSIIMDGRDIGTNVFKDAELKFYITASPEERARRRYLELVEKGVQQDYDSVLSEIIIRDRNDSTRPLNPLKQAEDAILIDTTSMNIDEVKASMMEEIGKWQR